MAIKTGDPIVVELAKTRGYCRWGGVAERIDEPSGTVFVRLNGFGEAPYQAGDYIPVNADKVRAMGGW